MEGEAGDQDGEPLSARDAAAVGDGFLDQLCPLLVFALRRKLGGCPSNSASLVRLLLALPAAAWHQTIARRPTNGLPVWKLLAALAASLSRPDTAPVASGKSCSSQAGRRRRRQRRTFSRPRQGGCCSSAGGWRPNTGPAGNEPSRQRAGPMRKLKPEPEKAPRWKSRRTMLGRMPSPKLRRCWVSSSFDLGHAQPKPWPPPL